MHRLTVEKNPVDMGYHLAHNCCYIKDHKARYRDFNIDVDCRDFARELMLKYGLWDKDQDNKLLDNNLFDDVMIDNLQYDSSELTGLIALLYRNMWAMAELRETLKQYEDAEQEGQLVRFPCKIYDRVYIYIDLEDKIYVGVCVAFLTSEFRPEAGVRAKIRLDNAPSHFPEYSYERLEEFGKTVFLTHEDAAKKAALHRN